MPVVRVRAVDDSGRVLHEQMLEHGSDPRQVLLEAGLVSRWSGAHLDRGHRGQDGEVLVLEYAVGEGERPVPFQRPAAYAVVVEPYQGRRCLLLSSFAHDSREPWGLPGGGIDEGEQPQDAMVREVWEETGQHVVAGDPVTVDSSHWTGHSPRGRLEDFHALRLVYRAHCPEPSEAVVQDVGGSTDRARWVPVVDVHRLRLHSWTPRVLDAAGLDQH